MNKGALVTSRKNLAAHDHDHLRRLTPSGNISIWQHSGVVVRGAYEGQVFLVDAISGRNIGTELTPVVDIMIAGKVISGVPVRCLDRVENVEK